MEAPPSPLSSRAQPRDLQFCGPFLEMFFDRAQQGAEGIGRVPHVRQSVRGPKTMGAALTIALAESMSEPMSDRASIRTDRPVTIRCCYDNPKRAPRQEL
jgi:hypothetical protein